MGGQRSGRTRGRDHRSAGSEQAAQPVQALNPLASLEVVKDNPVLQQVHVVLRELVLQGLERIESETRRKIALATFASMLQGNGPSFTVLQGA